MREKPDIPESKASSFVGGEDVVQKPNVLVVSHSYLVEENRKNIDALQKYAKVEVVVPDHANDVVHGKLGELPQQRPGLRVSVYSRIALWGSQYFLRSATFRMRCFKPEIIHIEYDPWSAISMQVMLSRRIFAPRAKIVCTVKNNTYRQYPGLLGRIKMFFASKLVAKVHRYIVVNRGVEQIYSDRFNIPPGKLNRMQHLGVDTSLFAPTFKKEHYKDHGKLVVGYCGRLDEEKGIQDLIEAIRNINNNRERLVQLRLLGNGPMRQALRQFEKDENWLRVTDAVPHEAVARFLSNVDLFVLPSRITKQHEEQDAHAVLEALSCGIATIGSTSGILPEILGNGVGLVFLAGDVADLERKIRLVIDNPELRKRKARSGRAEVFGRYSLEAIAKGRIAVYRQVLQ